MTAYRSKMVLLFAVLLMVGISPGAFAVGVDADKTLLTTAQQAASAGKWDEAVKALESLHQQYPDSSVQPDGLVLLYQAYLEQKAAEKSSGIGKEVVARWPKSSYVWQVVLITCKYKAKTSANDAVAALDLALQQNMLSSADRAKAQKMRFTYLESGKSDQFITEVLDKINGLKPPIAQNDLLSVADLAQHVYLPLMVKGRMDDAKAVSGKIQELLVKAGNPQGAVQADQNAYLKALKDTGSPRYYEEAITTIKMIELADTIQEAQVSVYLMGPLYLELLQKRPYEEVKALHVTVETALKRLQATDMIFYDVHAWQGGLRDCKPELLGVELQSAIIHLKEAKALTDSVFSVGSTHLVYESAFKNRQVDEAKSLHAQVQDFLARFNQLDDAVLDNSQFACARLKYLRETAKPQYLTEVTGTLVAIADQAKTLEQVRPALSMAVYYGPYPDLFQSGRVEDAKKVFEHIQAAITRIDANEITSLNLNLKAYLLEFGRSDPENFLKIFQPMVAKTANGSTANDLQFLVDISQAAYGALFEADRKDDAKQIHLQLQAAMQRLPSMKATADTEMKQYLTALSQASPNDFIAEVQPVLKTLEKAQTLEQAQQCAPVVQMAYGPMNQTGSFQEARTAHDQLQALYKKLNRTTEADIDNKIYQANLSVQALDGMLQLFKKAMVVKDMVVAKKWLDELNNAALASPQASRARAIWKDAGGK